MCIFGVCISQATQLEFKVAIPSFTISLALYSVCMNTPLVPEHGRRFRGLHYEMTL